MATLDLQRCVSITESEGATVITEAHSSWSTGWVAALAPDPDRPLYRYIRSYLDCDEKSLILDYMGPKTYRDLPDGIYEASSLRRAYAASKVIFRVADGEIEVLHYPTGSDSFEPILAELNGLDVPTLRARLAAEALAADEAGDAGRWHVDGTAYGDEG